MTRVITVTIEGRTTTVRSSDPARILNVGPPGQDGEGAVSSVNGQVGVVVLDAADVSADPTGTATAAIAAHLGAADPHTQYLTAAEGSAAFDAAGAATIAQAAAIAAAATDATTKANAAQSAATSAAATDATTKASSAQAAAISAAATDATTKANTAQAAAIQRANHTGTQSADTLTDGTTNKAFLATERTKLSGIATSATANSSDATLLARANHTGTQSADTITDGTTNKAYTATEKTKLAGVATGATANASDATLLARANHTGTQAATTVTFSPTGTVAATDVQAAIAEVATDAAADATSKANAAAAASQPLDSDLTAIAALTTTSTGRSLLAGADAAALRTILALGTAAITNTGTGAGNTILGNDSRLTDSRTPTTHASTHAAGGGDAITITEAQVTNLVADLAAKMSSATFGPEDHGYLAWAYDPAAGANTGTIIGTGGQLQLVRLKTAGTQSITSATVEVTVAGGSLTNVGFALYSAAGARLTSSINANGATAAAFQSVGTKTVTFSSQSISGAFYVGFWFTGTTLPTLYRSTNLARVGNFNLSAPNLRYATADGSLTTTAPANFGTQTALTTAFWVAAG